MTMNDLTNISQIALALAKAQAEFPLIAKTKTAHIQTKGGSMFSYDYADLAVLIGAVRPALAKYELAFSQFPEYEDGFLKLTTILMHSSGQYLINVFRTRVSADDLKAVGTAITYIRRYSLSAILGVASDEDKDDPTEDKGGEGARKGGRTNGRQVGTSDRSNAPLTASANANATTTATTADGKDKPKQQHTVETVRAYLDKVTAEGKALTAEDWRKINRTVTRLATELGLEDAINSHSMIEGVEVSDKEARDNTINLLLACEAEKTPRQLEGK